MRLPDAASAVADLLWPRRCAACDGPTLCRLPFCDGCAAALEPLPEARSCPRCAGLLDGGTCADCRRLQPVFAAARAIYMYGGPLRQALLRLKWQDRDDLGAPLGALLADALRELAPRVDLLVPVPLHRGRLVERGYDQAVLLGRAARRAAGVRLPLVLGLLARRDAAAPSARLGWAQRRGRAAGAFVVRGDGARGRRVLLLDDVLTTGATAQACAQALLQAGAARVEVLTLCRTIT